MYRNFANSAERTIRRGISCRELINRLPQNVENLDAGPILVFFHDLQNAEYMTTEDIQHFRFQTLLNRTEFLIPRMTAHDLSDIAISILNHTLLKQHNIKDQIQNALILTIEELRFVQMLHLGVIIRKTLSSIHFELIHLKIRKIFLENAKHFLLSYRGNDIRSLNTIAGYMTRNVGCVRTDILEAFANALLHTDTRQLGIHTVKTIIVLFFKFNKLRDQSKYALNEMVNVWIENDPRPTDIEELLSHLSRNGILDKQACTESGLIRFISTVLDKRSGNSTINCFTHLMKLGYWREGILGIIRSSQTLRPNALHAFFAGLRKEDNITIKDIQNPNFQRFLKETETMLPQMDAPELTNIAIGMLKHKLLHQQEFCNKIENALMPKVNEVPFQEMLQLDININKSKSTDSFQSIRLKFRKIFLENVEHFLAEHKKNIQVLISIAHYLEKNMEIVDMKILEAFSDAINQSNDKPLNTHDLVSIILVYSKFDKLDGQSENALNEIVHLWIQCNPTLKEIETLLYQLSLNRAKLDKQAFEESGLIRFSSLSEKYNEIAFSAYEHLMRMGYCREGIEGIARCSGNLSMFPQTLDRLKSTTVQAFFTGSLQSESVTEEDFQNPEFQSFLDRSKPIISQMNSFELFHTALAIVKYKALLEHEIADEVCNALLLGKLQNLPLGRVMQLDYKMRQSKLSNFSEKIQTKIQEIFLEKVEHFFIGHINDMKEFFNIVTYMSDHFEIISMDILKQFACALLLLDEHQLKIIDIINIIKVFSRFDELDGQSKIALKKIVKLWIEYIPTSRDITQLITLISDSKIDKFAFDESGLIRFILNHLEEKSDYGIRPYYGLLIRMGYWRESIDSLSKLFTEGPSDLDMIVFIEMCCACVKYDYKPNNWETSIFPALQSFDFCSHIDEIDNFSWPGFALKLHSLGYCDTKLIETVLISTKFKNSIYIDCLGEILTKHESNDTRIGSPKLVQLQTLIKHLEEIFGLENILIDHRVNEQCTIPFVLLINLETKEFLPIAWNWLEMRRHEQLIGIIIAKEGEEESDLESIESGGNRIKFIKLMPSSWLMLPESERKTLLLEKIDDAINSEE